LAALLLKLGGYGLIRFILTFLLLSHIYNFLILSLSLVGRVIISIICLVQIDLKKLVAYSSVVHINFILSCICTLNKIGFMGAFIIIIGHGLCSSRLFYIVNIFYLKSGRRVIFLNKGMISNLPSYSL
jgi:NADH-ubiquinone oxidoreductase chain 4